MTFWATVGAVMVGYGLSVIFFFACSKALIEVGEWCLRRRGEGNE